MNKQYYIFLFFLALNKINSFFGAAKKTDTSLSSSSSSSSSSEPSTSLSSSIFAKASPDTSSTSSDLSEPAGSIPFTGKAVPFSTFQQKTLGELKTSLRGFPPGLPELITEYAPKRSPEEATKDLMAALQDTSLDEKTKFDRVKNAIENDANLNNELNPNEYKNSPLYYAVGNITPYEKIQANLDIIQLLVNKGAHVKAETIFQNGFPGSGITWNERRNALTDLLFPIYYTYYTDHDHEKYIKTLRLLLEKGGIEIIQKPSDEYSILVIFLNSRNPYEDEIIKLLLEFGADPEKPSIGQGKFSELIKGNSVLEKIYNDYKAKKLSSESTSSSSSSSSSKQSGGK